MAKKDYAAMRAAIIDACGGAGNIASVSHCMTRLRLTLRDAGRLDEAAGRKVPGVISLIVQNGEYQFVVGQDVPSRASPGTRSRPPERTTPSSSSSPTATSSRG